MSAVIEYLLDQRVGTEYSDDPEENEIFVAKNLIKHRKSLRIGASKVRRKSKKQKKILLSRKLKKAV